MHQGIVLVLVTFLTVSCATGSGVVSGPKPLMVSSLQLPGEVRASIPYEAVFLGLEKADPSIQVTEACFTWSSYRGSDGPYCFPASEKEKRVAVKLVTRNPNRYTLTGFLRYRRGTVTGQSNEAVATLRVQ